MLDDTIAVNIPKPQSKEEEDRLVNGFLAGLEEGGIAYELVIGATGAYIAGDGVTQFSLTIGVYLFSMGLGSFLSRQVTKNLLSTFIGVEIVVGLVGGFANVILFMVYGFLIGYEVVFYVVLVFVGMMIGLEIPLLTRVNEMTVPSLKYNLGLILKMDYIGSFIGALVWVFCPRTGSPRRWRRPR